MSTGENSHSGRSPEERAWELIPGAAGDELAARHPDDEETQLLAAELQTARMAAVGAWMAAEAIFGQLRDRAVSLSPVIIRDAAPSKQVTNVGGTEQVPPAPQGE